MKVNWDDDSVKDDNQFGTKYKVKAGKMDRIFIVDKNAVLVMRHYKNSYFVCTKESGKCVGCSRGLKATKSFVARVVQYSTESDGKLSKPFKMELKTWVFGYDKFATLRSKAKVHGSLQKIDLMTTCNTKRDEKFQDIDIDVAPKCLFATNAKVKKKVLELVKKSDIDLKSQAARTLTLKEQAKLFLEGSQEDESFSELDDDSSVSELENDLFGDDTGDNLEDNDEINDSGELDDLLDNL